MTLGNELRSALPDAGQITVDYPKVKVCFEQAEYAITHLSRTGAVAECITVFATFRDIGSEHGGTWWQHWYQPCTHDQSDARLAALIAAEIGRSLARFTELLGEHAQHSLSIA